MYILMFLMNESFLRFLISIWECCHQGCGWYPLSLCRWIQCFHEITKTVICGFRLTTKQLMTIHLKTVDTIGNCQRPVFSLGVSQHMHKITNVWKFELNWSSKLRGKVIMEEKTPLSHEVVCFQMLEFETSNSKSEVSKSNTWKITSFSKTTSLQREPFLTMFYTINISPLLVTK